MNSIITHNSSTDHELISKTDRFFTDFSISKLLKKSNFYKSGGIQCTIILKEVFGLVFSGKNLYRTLQMNPNDLSFKQNTVYRFLNNSTFNWSRLLMLLVTQIITILNDLTSVDRKKLMILP